MKIGVPKEIISQEYRVSINPETAKLLLESSHQLFIQKNAGVDSGYSDQEYTNLGCTILDNAIDVFHQSDLIIKVKEPSLDEVELMKNKMLFTYLHLSSSKILTEKLLECNVIALAYETVVINNETPMLKPMSEIAGRLSLLDSIELLKKSKGGKGKLISGTSLSDPANVLIIGAGIVGINAMQMSLGLGANTTILDINNELLSKIKTQYKKLSGLKTVGDKIDLNKKKVASIGTLGVKSKNLKMNLLNTTIDPIKLSKILSNLKKRNIDNVIMEASSHGLKQNRLDGLLFNTGIFTN